MAEESRTMRSIIRISAGALALAAIGCRSEGPEVAAVASVSVSVGSTQLAVGQATTATAAARSSRGDALAGRGVAWSSSNASVVSVGGSGTTVTLTAVAAGQATVSATIEGIVGTSPAVHVVAVPVASVDVTLSQSQFMVGEIAVATAELRDQSGNTLTGRAVMWTSSDASIATVAGSGLTATVAAVGEGEATITAASEGISGSAGVTVSKLTTLMEQGLALSYRDCRNVSNASSGPGTRMFAQLAAMALESYSQRSDLGMAQRSTIPRRVIDNSVAAQEAEMGVFWAYEQNARGASAVVQMLDELVFWGGTLGSPARDLRARAFGLLGIGCNLGWLSLAYDSAPIITHLSPYEALSPLAGAHDVNAASLAMLDSAIAVANAPEPLRRRRRVPGAAGVVRGRLPGR
jgi:hypothetical protein